jgi:hypothetical protein
LKSKLEAKLKIDKTTKLLLLAIALGLWINGLAPLFRPAPVAAQESEALKQLKDIAHDVHVIDTGVCLNSKIC